jgi:hypothetical protein
MVKYVKYLTHIATKSDNSIILLIILQNLSQPLENISGMFANPWGSDLYFLHFRFAKTQKDKRQPPFPPF